MVIYTNGGMSCRIGINMHALTMYDVYVMWNIFIIVVVLYSYVERVYAAFTRLYVQYNSMAWHGSQ